jgi:hypothetical protein
MSTTQPVDEIEIPVVIRNTSNAPLKLYLATGPMKAKKGVLAA